MSGKRMLVAGLVVGILCGAAAWQIVGGTVANGQFNLGRRQVAQGKAVEFLYGGKDVLGTHRFYVLYDSGQVGRTKLRGIIGE